MVANLVAMAGFVWMVMGLLVIGALLVIGVTQVLRMNSGRPLASGGSSEEVEQLKRRIAELEAGISAHPEPEPEDRIPTKSEENLAAEDRWRLDMLEARLEELEKRRRRDSDGPA